MLLVLLLQALWGSREHLALRIAINATILRRRLRWKSEQEELPEMMDEGF